MILKERRRSTHGNTANKINYIYKVVIAIILKQLVLKGAIPERWVKKSN